MKRAVRAAMLSRVGKKRTPGKRGRKRATLAELKENRTFSNRLRFDQSVFWEWNRREPGERRARSMYSDIEDSMRRYGPPASPISLWAYDEDLSDSQSGAAGGR